MSVNPIDDEQPLEEGRTPGPVEELYARHLAGDAQASEELVAQVTPQLQRLARELGAASDRSDDAVQDAWVALLSQGGYDRRRALLPWLRGALRNRWRSLRRRERLVALQNDETALAGLESPRGSASAEALEAFRLVREALARLPATYREPLALHLFAEWGPSEIAARMGTSPQRVRVLLHRGRQRLQRLLPRGAFVLLAALLRRGSSHPVPRSTWGLGALVAALLAVVVVPFASSRAAEEPAWMAARPAEPASDRKRAFEAENEPSSAEARRLPESDALASGRSVIVRDEEGAPMPNVGVTLVPREGRDPRLTQRRAVTDELGRARFDGVESSAARVLVDRGPVAELAAGQREVGVVVPRGVTLRVRALEADGTAVAGAEVWFGDVAGSRRGGGVGCTAADGRFELRDVPRGSSYALLAHGFLRTAMLAVPHDGEEVVLRLERGGAELSLALRDDAGAPVVGARVLLGASPDGISPRLAGGVVPAFPPPLEARSDPAGRAQLAGLETGKFPLVVWAEGFVPHVETLALDEGERRDLEVTLERGARIHGRVVTAEGAPLPIAQVAVHVGREPEDTQVELSPQGEFELTGLRAGRIDLAVRAWDHATEERSVELAAGERRELVFTLPELVRCEGTLRDDAGRALAGFRLRLLGQTESAFAPNSDETTVGTDGRFSLAVPGAQIRRIEFAWPASPQWKPARRSWLVESPGRLDIVVPSATARRQCVRGRLVAADTTSVALRTLSLIDWSGGWELVSLERVARTAADGSFVIDALAAGHYELFVVQDSLDADGAPVGRVGSFEIERDDDTEVRFDLPEAAELRWELAFGSGERPRAPVVSLASPGVGTSVALARSDAATGRLRLWPCTFDLGAQGEDFMARHAPPRDLRPGETCTWAPQLLEAFEVELALDALPDELTEHARLDLLRVDDGSVVSSFERAGELSRDGKLRTHLAPGEYQLRTVGFRLELVQVPFSVNDAGSVQWPRNH